MITGDLKSKIDRIWDAFWSGGIANPLEVIEQITYLLFLRRLDDLHTLEENKATRTRRPMARRIFPKGSDDRGRAYDDLRWSRFKDFAPAEMFTVVGEHVFPFLRTLGGDGSTYAHHMRDARFTIPTPALLAKVVDAQRERRTRRDGVEPLGRRSGRPRVVRSVAGRPGPGSRHGHHVSLPERQDPLRQPDRVHQHGHRAPDPARNDDRGAALRATVHRYRPAWS